MKKKFFNTKSLILRDVNLNSFKEKINKDYSIVKDGINRNFKWGEVEESEIEYLDDVNTIIKKTILRIECELSHLENGIESIRKVPVMILEKKNDLYLIVKCNESDQTTIKSKLLGQYGASPSAKKAWKNIKIELPENKFDLRFFLWLISKENKLLVNSNMTMQINEIITLTDNGIHITNLKRRSVGSEILKDPIMKAIVSTIDSIESIGLRVSINRGDFSFILDKNGEIDIREDSQLREPIHITLKKFQGYEKIICMIKEVIIKFLYTEYERDELWNDEKIRELKLQNLYETIEKMCEVLGITRSLDRPISEITSINFN